MANILSRYGFGTDAFTIRPLGNGLINSTWLVESGGRQFVLQKINDAVFRNPEDIAFNIKLVADHFKQFHPGYFFVRPVQTVEGLEMVYNDDGYFRMFPFVKNSHTIDVVDDPAQAYEAAKQFAKFTRLLSRLDVHQLKITLPDFHNLSLRYAQFENALLTGNEDRIGQAGELTEFMKRQKSIVDEFEFCRLHFTQRCTHHDTKISNVLFDEKDRGLCVIDLDTVMPGYFISDVGDMMRTYLSPVSEEETDLSKIMIRREFYEAIVDGYLSEMGKELNDLEKKSFHYAGKFMIYMQALRFLTDHLNNDIYYGAKYEGHNLKRAANQITLLKKLQEFNPG
jgi:Ser/Thr protein kinase RdoA (MazF antagonist)